MQKIDKICVTGGAGFIGSKLVNALIQRGLEVIVLDDLSVGKACNVARQARLVVGSILDPKDTAEAIEGCDAVIHMAARVAIRSSFEFAVEDATTNVVGTAAVLRAAQRAGSVRKVVVASSMAVYADASDASPVSERHPTEPVSAYGISKLAAEMLTHSTCAQAGIDSVVLRLFNTYGPGQSLSPYVGVVTIFCDKLSKGVNPTIYGDGCQCRDFVHVEDVVQGFLCALESNITGETFNIGSGAAITVNQVLQLLQRELGTSVLSHFAPAQPCELRFSVADISKARRLLGYQPSRVFASVIGQVVKEIVGNNIPVASSL
jgi:UDP-glucose 4-epimerase